MAFRAFLCLTSILMGGVLAGLGQDIGYERSRHKTMLRVVRDDVKKNYFDPTFKSIDIEANYRNAISKMEQAESISQMDGIIAQFLLDFDDSHLFFLPPGRSVKVDYGFDFQMMGDKCLVTQIDSGSAAEKLGLQLGDELWSIAGFAPKRETLWKLRYLLLRLQPQPGLNVVVRRDGKEIPLAIAAKVTQGRRLTDLTGNDLQTFIVESENRYRKAVRQYYFDRLPGAFIWKMPAFSIDPASVDEIMGKAKKFPALLIDLRGNGGGRVDMVLRLVANLFDQDIKMGVEKTREGSKDIIAKTRGTNAYAGKLAVLIDSESGSASEVFSRVIQLEKRGLVIGDQSAGAVMESRVFGHELGTEALIFYASSVTIADLTMKDGKGLEKVGVTPDVTLIPTGPDLAAKRDRVLARALESLGVSVTAEAAGAIFARANDEN